MRFTPRRPRALPAGAGFVIAALASLLLWAFIAGIVVVA